MNAINVEIYVLLIVAVIFFEYYQRFRYRFTDSSKLFLMALGSIAFVSLANITLATINLSLSLRYIMLTLSFYVIILLPLFFYQYIQENFLLSSWYKQSKKYIKFTYLIFVPVWILFTFLRLPDVLLVPYAISDYYFYHFLLILSISPIMALILEYAYNLFIKKERKDTNIFIITIIAFLGVIAEILTKEYALLTPVYSIIILLLYNHKMNSMNSKDVLTGLYNREIINKIQANRRSNNRKLIVYMIDVNKFKHINDTYGHKKGDEILKDIAKILFETVRKTDYVIRFGGDEFIILADLSYEKDALIIVDKINDNLAKYNRFKKIKVGLSIGYEALKLDKHGNYDFYKSLAKADKKMYEEKKKRS